MTKLVLFHSKLPLTSKSFIPVTIDVDNPEAVATRIRYSVGVTPSTIVTDPQGNVLQLKIGGVGKPDFMEMLGKLNSTVGEM